MLSFNLSKQALKDLQAVAVKGGISKDRYLAINNYYCKVGAGYLRVYTSNNDYYLTRLVKIDNDDTNENVFLATSDFFDFKSDCQYNIDIDNQTAVITSNNVKSTKQVFKDVSGFPQFANNNMDLISIIDASELIQLLKVKNAVYKDKYGNYEVFRGILFDIKDNVFNTVATNRAQLCWYYLNGESNYLKDFYGIINEKAINALVKVIHKYNGDIYINSNGQYIRFTFNNVELITKLIEGNFPQYQAVLLEGNEGINTIIFNKQEMINALNGLLTKEIIAVNVKFTNNQILLSNDNAEAIVDYQSDNDVTNYSLAINGKYTIEFLKTLPTNIDNITFYFKEPIKPLEMRANNFILVMTPVRQ